MKILNRILFVILMLIIPSTCIVTAVNVSYRMPDVYRYEFNRSGITDEINLDETTDNLAKFFSDYMLGTLDNFQYTAIYMGRERPIFGIGEGSAMAQIRGLFNISLACLVIMALLVVFIICFLLWQQRKEAVRIAYRIGLVLYVIMIGAIIVITTVQEFRDEWLGKLFIYQFEETDLLPQLLPPSSFLTENNVVIVVISLVMITAGYSVIKRLTLPDRMFY